MCYFSADKTVNYYLTVQIPTKIPTGNFTKMADSTMCPVSIMSHPKPCTFFYAYRYSSLKKS
jgi:hypothetical protein